MSKATNDLRNLERAIQRKLKIDWDGCSKTIRVVNNPPYGYSCYAKEKDEEINDGDLLAIRDTAKDMTNYLQGMADLLNNVL